MTGRTPRSAAIFTRGLASAASSCAPRPFRVLGLQQVAIGGLDKRPLTDLWQACARTHTQATHPPARSPTRSRPFIDPWQGLLGVERTGSYRSESENVDEVAVTLTLTLTRTRTLTLSRTDLSRPWRGRGRRDPNPNPNPNQDILRLGSGPWAVELDLMQPLDPERAPRVHVPALNHIGLWVDKLTAAVEHLQGYLTRPKP